jgi:hypothetical protein
MSLTFRSIEIVSYRSESLGLTWNHTNSMQLNARFSCRENNVTFLSVRLRKPRLISLVRSILHDEIVNSHGTLITALDQQCKRYWRYLRIRRPQWFNLMNDILHTLTVCYPRLSENSAFLEPHSISSDTRYEPLVSQNHGHLWRWL